MSFVHCSCDCKYQQDGFCNLEKASEITNVIKQNGCLYYVARETKKLKNFKTGKWLYLV